MSKTSLHFEWDSNKALINQNIHGITFTEASTVFYANSMPLLQTGGK